MLAADNLNAADDFALAVNKRIHLIYLKVFKQFADGNTLLSSSSSDTRDAIVIRLPLQSEIHVR